MNARMHCIRAISAIEKGVLLCYNGHMVAMYGCSVRCIAKTNSGRKDILMKHTISKALILLLVCMLVLTACASPAPESTPAATEKPVGTTGSNQHTDPQKPTDPTVPTTPSEPVDLPETNVYLVGDSTVCGFSDSYFYPRYGYGTQLGNYLSEKVTVHNLAMSGRSSKSFLAEANYQTLKDNLKEGDFLIIGFGHNDEKSDDAARFTDASKPYTDPTSFGYHLYEYYIKLAQEKGATVILCTPIVRAATDNDYTGSEAHVTDNGDYRQAILDLANAVGVPVVDLTGITKARYEQLGFEEAMKYHAVIAGQLDTDGITIVANNATVDKTHLNIYGAKYVAYRLACELQHIEAISGYVLPELTEPTVADLVPNPDYVVTDYVAPDLDNYAPVDHFTTITSGWYGTAFGNTGGNPQSTSNGYIAKEVSEGVFQVGQTAGSNKGKFESGSDGFAFLFRQIEADKNFSITVTGTVITSGNTKQAGFGLMLRDDVVIDQDATSTISSNYVTAGVLATSEAQMCVLFSRENAVLTKSENFVTPLYAVGDTFTMTIERVGQSVTTTVVFKGQTYTHTYYDFDFLARDTQYMYVGMFANRGTIVEFTNVEFTILGDSQGA